MTNARWQWARCGPGYEVSTAGDKRFSALNARLIDGRTIEEAYQLDVKGYRAPGRTWKDGKGKVPLNGKSREQLWIEYLALWVQWSEENPALIEALRAASVASKLLTDRFAVSEISQARALAMVLDRGNPHPFRIFRIGLDECATCQRPRAEHVPREPLLPELPAQPCECKPPKFVWADCPIHYTPWKP